MRYLDWLYFFEWLAQISIIILWLSGLVYFIYAVGKIIHRKLFEED